MDKAKILLILSYTLNADIDEIRNYPNDKPLIEIGFTSMCFIRFIVTVEEEFNIEIYDSDLLLKNFQTIDLIFKTLHKYFEFDSVKKVLICDCDNVLWHGIAGEEEIYIDDKNIRFQNTLIQLYNNGVLICLCSKNEPTNIDNAFDLLYMPLSKEHITLSKVNLLYKFTNIKLIAAELNLSLDSVVFIDDSDYEIGLINALLPEVETIKVNYTDVAFIDEIKSKFTQQSSDINRTTLYKQQKEREKEKFRFDSIDEYNDSLNTEIVCTIAEIEQAKRIAELSQRTNQFNLSGTRYTSDEITEYINNDSYIVLYLSAQDKYGDMGIVGTSIIKFEFENETAVIESFNLSCRVFDRGFEYVMIDTIKNLVGGKTLRGIYNRTDKNHRYVDFWSNVLC